MVRLALHERWVVRDFVVLPLPVGEGWGEGARCFGVVNMGCEIQGIAALRSMTISFIKSLKFLKQLVVCSGFAAHR